MYFTFVNHELIFILSDRVTANILIINKLRGYWSLVTCTFTLSLLHLA